MAIVMTERQKDDLNRKGFFIVENLLSAHEVAAVAAAMDQVAAEVRAERGLGPGDRVALRNGMIRHETLLDLMDHPAILELVVDAYGWNIHNRDSVTLCGPPQPAGSDPDVLSLGWHFDYEEEFCGSTVDGTLPLLDFKVGWYISDHTEPGHSTILVVPGSYRWSRQQRATWEEWLDPAEIVAVRVPAGSVMLWRPTLLHSVSPNLSATERKAIYVSYTPRWVRPSGHLEQDAELIARSSPVRRQLLGAMGEPEPSARQRSGQQSQLPVLVHRRLGHRAAEGVGRGACRRAALRLGHRPGRQPHQGSGIRVHAGDRPRRHVFGILVRWPGNRSSPTSARASA